MAEEDENNLELSDTDLLMFKNEIAAKMNEFEKLKIAVVGGIAKVLKIKQVFLSDTPVDDVIAELELVKKTIGGIQNFVKGLYKDNK